MHIIPCNLHWSRQKRLNAISSVNWQLRYQAGPEYLVSPVGVRAPVPLMAPPQLCPETDRQGVLDHSPAGLRDLLNMIPVRRISSSLAHRFPGERRSGKFESPLSLHPSHHHCFSFFHVHISFVLLGYPHAPRLYSAPLFTSSGPGRSLFSDKRVLFKIMFDALTARTKTV